MFFKKLEPDAFAQKCMNLLIGMGHESELSYDQEQFRIGLGENSFLNLDNVYTRYMHSSIFRRGKVIREFLSSFMEQPEDLTPNYAEAKQHLFPAVKDVFTFEAIALGAMANGPSPKFQTRAISERLCSCLMFDTEKSMWYVTGEHLADWGLDFDEAMAVAMENLKARTTQPLKQVEKGVYLSPWRDSYDASRIMLPDVLRGLEIEGERIIFTPTRDYLIVVDSDEPGALNAGLGIAHKIIAEGGHAISVVPHKYQWPNLIPLTLPEHHPCYELLQHLQISETATLYQQQQYYLDKADDQGTHIGPFKVLRDGDNGKIFTTTIFMKGQPNLLPQADMVILVDPELEEDHQIVANVSWQVFTETCGQLLEPTDYVMKRVRANTFPDEATIKRLSEQSIM